MACPSLHAGSLSLIARASIITSSTDESLRTVGQARAVRRSSVHEKLFFLVAVFESTMAVPELGGLCLLVLAGGLCHKFWQSYASKTEH